MAMMIDWITDEHSLSNIQIHTHVCLQERTLDCSCLSQKLIVKLLRVQHIFVCVFMTSLIVFFPQEAMAVSVTAVE